MWQMFTGILSNWWEIELRQILDMYSEKSMIAEMNYCVLLGNRLAESNDDVRILSGSSKVGVSAHAQWKYGIPTIAQISIYERISGSPNPKERILQKCWICTPLHYRNASGATSGGVRVKFQCIASATFSSHSFSLIFCLFGYVW